MFFFFFIFLFVSPLYVVESFLNRSVNLDWTTISFDFDANLPPPMSIDQSYSSSIHVSSPSSPLLNPVFDNNDSTASLVYIAHDPMDDLLCEPFIGTPEPSFSPPIFEAVSISESVIDDFISYDPMPSYGNISYESVSPNHMSYEPSMPNNNNISYDTSSPLSLLPLLLPPPEHDANSQLFLPTFELVFMDDNVYEQFIDEHHPQLEVEVLSAYERSDRTLIYEEL